MVSIQATKLCWTYDQQTDAKLEGYEIEIGTGPAPIKIWRDTGGSWCYETGDGGQEYISEGEPARLITLVSQVTINESSYELSADINLTATATENGMEFTVTTPFPNVLFTFNNEQIEAVFDSSVSILPI